MDGNSKQRQEKITFFKGEKSGSESMFQQLFGKIPEEAALFILAAAPESARMTIGMDDNGIYLELIEPIRFGLTAQLRIVRTPDGKIELRIDDYRFLRRAARGHGIGTGLFIRLIQSASGFRTGTNRPLRPVCSGRNRLGLLSAVRLFTENGGNDFAR